MLLPGVSGIVPNPSSWFDFGAAINGFIVLVLTLLHQLGRDTELKIERFCVAVSYVILQPARSTTPERAAHNFEEVPVIGDYS